MPDSLKARFAPAAEDAEVTHTLDTDEEGDYLFLAAVGEGLEIALGSSDAPTKNYSIEDPAKATAPDAPQLGGDFGGGSSDGGGAGDGF